MTKGRGDGPKIGAVKAERFVAQKRVRDLQLEIAKADAPVPRLPKPPADRRHGGISRKDVGKIREAATRYLTTGDSGLEELEAVLTHTTLVAVLIEGVYGTELWRTAGQGQMGRIFAAGNRSRFIESATRLLKELREAREERGEHRHPLLDRVVELDKVKPLKPWQDNLFKPGDENPARRKDEQGESGDREAADAADGGRGGEAGAGEAVAGGPVGVADGDGR